MAHTLGDEFPASDLDRLVRDAFSFPAPTVHVEDRRHVLELFHGPTLAFKDFGARFLARVFGYLLAERGDHATILVATSGDTGSAVAQGFHGVPGVRVVVLYPAGKVSPFQEAQMATLGGNVDAVRVPGTFDDCQRLVKAAFLDGRLAALHLSSANSINIGRLLPQSVYYFASWLQVAGADEPIVFVVPSGNLGNITAGVMAQRMGLNVAGFVAASNLNDVLPEFLRTGVYRARPSIATLSNAMDVGDPSNFARLMALHGGSTATLRSNVAGFVVTDEATRATIRDVYARCGYLLDPHTAVGFTAARLSASGSRNEAHQDLPHVVLATAHPAKFSGVVERELGFVPPLPEPYRDWATRPLLAHDLADTSYEGFRDWLLAAR
jgi:threonine synthase